MLYRDFTTLLDVTDGGTDPIVGDTIALNPLPVDGVADHEQAVLVLATGAWTGANGSIQVILETSADAENWMVHSPKAPAMSMNPIVSAQSVVVTTPTCSGGMCSCR
jgi:hypothetical protein